MNDGDNPEYISPLKFAVVEITNSCNLRCAHCASTSGVARDEELSIDEITTILRDIRSLGGEEITILGGEPLMRKDWFDICRSVKELDMRLVVISNGVLVSATQTVPQLSTLEPHVIGVSMDGATPESYRRVRGVDAFDHVLSVLHRLHDDGHGNVNAVTTFSRDNLRDFDAFADLFDATGINWQVQLAHRAGNRFHDEHFLSLEDYSSLVGKLTDLYAHRPTVHLCTMDDFGYFPVDPKLKFLHQTWKGCPAGRQLLGIRSNGDVMGCLSLGNRFVEANIRKIPLRDIWQSGRFFGTFRNKAIHLKGKCLDCAFGIECTAGCTALALSATGHMGENPYCIRAVETDAILGALFD